MEPVDSKAYLGDGVYVEYDGWGVWLRANSPDSPKEVYLEPVVFNALARFWIHQIGSNGETVYKNLEQIIKEFQREKEVK
jgi:very-short-patch-repair endonuclease